MRFMVSKSIVAAIVITAGGMATHIAKAADTTIKVPFSFTVAGYSMPAGLYTVEEDTYHNVVTLKSRDTTKCFSAVLNPGDPAPGDTHVALEFDQSGNAHILKSIQYGSKVTSALDKGEREQGFDPSRLSQGR